LNSSVVIDDRVQIGSGNARQFQFRLGQILERGARIARPLAMNVMAVPTSAIVVGMALKTLRASGSAPQGPCLWRQFRRNRVGHRVKFGADVEQRFADTDAPAR
jgi:hypothetical protein